LPCQVLWSKAAKALSTTPIKRRDFCRAEFGALNGEQA
jgi:hypothetical protein